MLRARNASFGSSLRIGVFALLLGVASPALAQNIPNEASQEIIIKTSLLSFNDANLTSNYTVLNLLGSKPFRDNISAEKLNEAFKAFREKQIDLSAIVAGKIVATKPTVLDADNVLITEGYIDTPKLRVIYTLKHLLSDGKWRLLGINVKTDVPPA